MTKKWHKFDPLQSLGRCSRKIHAMAFFACVYILKETLKFFPQTKDFILTEISSLSK